MKFIIDQDIPFIKGRFPKEVETIYLSGKEIKPEDVKNADALIVRTRTKCDEKLLKGSEVRLVVTATIGTDHIDTHWCESNGISVMNAPGCNAPGVAQYVLTSLFQTGFKPGVNTLGIVGYGHVGQIVAKWADDLGIEVLICDPPRKDSGLSDVDYVDLEHVLKNSDAVTLHVPFTKDGKYPTRYMIGANELAIMKPGAVLINSSRGGVMDEKALKKILEEGQIKAVIDTWENEPEIDLELLDLVAIGTPHIAGYSAEGKIRATMMALENIRKFFLKDVDLEGLQIKPSIKSPITKEILVKSYDPLQDSLNLKQSPHSFESLRNHYSYRHEPLY